MTDLAFLIEPIDFSQMPVWFDPAGKRLIVEMCPDFSHVIIKYEKEPKNFLKIDRFPGDSTGFRVTIKKFFNENMRTYFETVLFFEPLNLNKAFGLMEGFQNSEDGELNLFYRFGKFLNVPNKDETTKDSPNFSLYLHPDVVDKIKKFLAKNKF